MRNVLYIYWGGKRRVFVALTHEDLERHGIYHALRTANAEPTAQEPTPEAK
jgi:hypothetical protein